jgi:hypothetical protein
MVVGMDMKIEEILEVLERAIVGQFNDKIVCPATLKS